MSVERLFEAAPSHWRLTTLGELAKSSGGDIQTGPFGSQLHASDYVVDGIPSIMPKNISTDSVLTDDIARVSPEDIKRLAKYKVQVGDIVYSRRGDVEKCARITPREDGWLCGTGCLRVRVLPAEVSTEYLHAYLCHPSVREWIVRHAVGATMPNLNTSILSALPVYIPSEAEMNFIAETWLSISEKIQLNRQINQTLEQMAQAIFQSWFVDFEPVKAKIAAREDWLARQAEQDQPHADAPPFASAASAAQVFAQASNQASNQAAKKASSETATDAAQSPAAQFPAALSPAEQADLEIFINRAAMCAISGKTDADLDAMPAADYQRLYHTASLFPDELVESELGEIPKGWAIGAIGDMLEFNPKRSLKKGSLAPYLDMKNVPTSGHLADEVVFREMGSGSKFINGDTLLARITPCLENGKTAFVDFLNDDEVGWGSTEFIVIRPKDGYPYSLGYLLARDSNFRQVAIQSMTGTSGRQRADAKALAEKNWVVYPKALMMEFGAFSESYLQLAKRNGDQISTLTHLRNSLLPKLLSGELDISALTDLADHAAEPGATHV